MKGWPALYLMLNNNEIKKKLLLRLNFYQLLFKRALKIPFSRAQALMGVKERSKTLMLYSIINTLLLLLLLSLCFAVVRALSDFFGIRLLFAFSWIAERETLSDVVFISFRDPLLKKSFFVFFCVIRNSPDEMLGSDISLEIPVTRLEIASLEKWLRLCESWLWGIVVKVSFQWS